MPSATVWLFPALLFPLRWEEPMELLPTALNAVFVLVMTVVLTWYIRDRFNEVDRRFAEQKQDTDRRFTEVRQDMAQIRSELITIALAVGARTGPDAANG